MKDTEANLMMSEAEEIKETAHSEDAQTTEIHPEETTTQIVEEVITQQQVIDPPIDDQAEGNIIAEKLQELEGAVMESPPNEAFPEPSIAVEDTAIQSESLMEEIPITEDDNKTEEEVGEAEEVEASAAAETDMTEPEIEEPGAEESEDADTETSIASNETSVAEELPTTPENYNCGDLQEAIEVGAISMIKKQDILDELSQLIVNIDHSTREQVEKLKHSYFRISKAETEELRKVFIENGGDEADFQVPEDELDSEFKELLAQYKHKKALLLEKDESKKEENYVKKLRLIDRLQALVESQEDFNKRYNEFKEIQQRWKEYNPVPHERVKELWRNYQIQSEKFYDLVKINNQFRDYDYKKNLELKTILCEAVERLAGEPDAISAYYQSQKLFLQWREIGPVARDVRETLWARFKTASAVVNKKYQTHFDSLKEKEEENLKEKTALCDTVEAIDYESLRSFNDWEKKTQEVIELQKKWHSIGFATKKHSSKIYDRFRKACDNYFNKKGAFYKSLKKEMEKNLQLRRQLIEKAEAMKERTDWKETTKEIIELQNEWKKIGPVSRKYSDLLWKQFITTCDFFFDQKNKTSNSLKTKESTNLTTKKLLIQKIKSIDEKLPNSEALTALKLLIAEWNTVGHVPFKEKDKIYKAFRDAVDKQYDRLNVAQSDRKMQQYRNILTEISDGGQNKGKLHSERDKLMRMYERMKQELQTFENNVGFFNVSSKGGGAMLKEMENRIERLKNEMELIVKKIDAIDENLE